MKNPLSNSKNAKTFARQYGRQVGSVLIAAFAAPPTTPEAAKETYDSIFQTKMCAEEKGAPQGAIEFYNGALDAIVAFIEAGERIKQREGVMGEISGDEPHKPIDRD